MVDGLGRKEDDELHKLLKSLGVDSRDGQSLGNSAQHSRVIDHSKRSSISPPSLPSAGNDATS